MDLDDVPGEWLGALDAEGRDATERASAEAIRQMAFCQAKA
jgi:hypothetical protein